MNFHVSTPTERLLYAAHQERMNRMWPARQPPPQAIPECANLTVCEEKPKSFFALAWQMLDPPHQKGKTHTIAFIKRSVSDYFQIPIVDLVSQRRTAVLVLPRHIGFFLAKKHSTASYPMIGRAFGGRDHTTALAGARKIEARMQTDPLLCYDIEQIERRFT